MGALQIGSLQPEDGWKISGLDRLTREWMEDMEVKALHQGIGILAVGSSLMENGWRRSGWEGTPTPGVGRISGLGPFQPEWGWRSSWIPPLGIDGRPLVWVPLTGGWMETWRLGPLPHPVGTLGWVSPN